MQAASFSAFAPAKVNLALHVVGRRADGYHLLDSLVAFASIGDRLDLSLSAPATDPALAIAGPHAPALDGGPDNLVRRAADAMARVFPAIDPATLAFSLEKNLPVASGIGGGSADAAAAIRLLARAHGIADRDPRLQEVALTLGADVPMCIASRPARTQGIGEQLTYLPDFPECPILLVNTGEAVATPDVFRALASRKNPPLQRLPDAGFGTVGELLDWLSEGRNDLEFPARQLAAGIGHALDLMRDLPGCRLARMSGSGATCFALFDRPEACEAGASRVSQQLPASWVAAGRLASAAAPIV